MTVLPAGTFDFGINKMVLVPFGILVPTPCVIRKISFENEFSQMVVLAL